MFLISFEKFLTSANPESPLSNEEVEMSLRRIERAVVYVLNNGRQIKRVGKTIEFF